MAVDRLSVLLEANDASLSSTIRRAGSTVDQFGNRVDAAGRTVIRAGNDMHGSFSRVENILDRGLNRSMVGFVAAATGGYAAGRALNTALQDVIGGAIQFQAQMLNVNSISHLSSAQLGVLSNQVLDLSRTLPTSAKDLASGLYDIASSGFQGAAGVKVLTASAKAATAGLTDTATSARAITGVLNAYGEKADQAKSVSDSLFQTVNVGVLSFADLAQGIGQVVGTAAAAGVNIDQLGAAVATMTRAGIVPAEAFTSLNQVLAQIIQPSQTMSGLFNKLGYTSGAAALQTKGLDGVMQDILRSTGGNITTMSELFTDIRALRGAMALTTDQGKLYADSITAQTAAHTGAGATAVTLAVQLQGVGAQWQILKNRAEDAAIALGTQLLPAINDVGGALEFVGTHGGSPVPLIEGALAGIVAWKAYSLAVRGAAAANLIAGTSALAAAGRVGGLVGILTAAAIEAHSITTRGNDESQQRLIAFAAQGGDALESVKKKYAELLAAQKAGLPNFGGVSDALLKQYKTAIDAAGGLDTTSDSTKKLVKQMDDLAAAQAQQDEINKKRASASSALSGAFDVVQQFDPVKAHQLVHDAQQKVIDANKAFRDAQAQAGDQGSKAAQRLADYEAQLQGKKKVTIAQEQRLRDLRAAAGSDPNTKSLADARQRLADATKNLADAQKQAKESSDLSTIYKHDLERGKQFVKDIRTDLKRGLDPAEIQRLLAAGPDQAGGLAHALATDKSGKLIRLSNQNERALAQLAVRASNLMQKALDQHPVFLTVGANLLPGSRGGQPLGDNGRELLPAATARPAARGSTHAVIVQQPVIVQPNIKHETNLNGVQFGDANAYERFEAQQRRRRSVW